MVGDVDPQLIRKEDAHLLAMYVQVRWISPALKLSPLILQFINNEGKNIHQFLDYIYLCNEFRDNQVAKQANGVLGGPSRKPYLFDQLRCIFKKR